MRKVKYPIDKKEWQPSLIPGPIVLISTYDSERTPNIAPKSWVQMVSSEPPVIMFSGSRLNSTEKNILEHRCFGVNLVDHSMVEKVYESIQWIGKERLEKTGFKFTEATEIQAPLVAESKAHLECKLHRTAEVGSGFVIFGEIVAASIWEEILSARPERRYELLGQTLFLEEGTFTTICDAMRVDGRTKPNGHREHQGENPQQPQNGEFTRYVILLSHLDGKKMSEDLIRAHVSYLKELEGMRKLVLCGPFADYRGGMIVVRAGSPQEARAIAESDPFVKSGLESYEIRTWHLSCEENNHMGMG